MAKNVHKPHFFGVRHHGPGCARSLVRALEALQPDCILIEGPPEADDQLRHLLDEGMVPPVALLVHAVDDPAKASFFPFAVFSPEWQALQWGARHQTPTRFMDLPVGASMALREAAQTEVVQQPDPVQDATTMVDVDLNAEAEPKPEIAGDPLTWLARSAGYSDSESWWNHMVEERGDGADLFAAIALAMRAAREDHPDGGRSDPFHQRREALREAHMRKTIRAAQKEGFERIAVVCGAWHVPALEMEVAAKADDALLKGLPKVKTVATWVPWTHRHLSFNSGYGAGITSPGWYEYLWNHDPEKFPRAVGWLSRVAKLLRERDIDCSPAHLIEAARLADALAAMRERPAPSLDDLNEVTLTTICFGNEAPLKLIHEELIVGDKVGQVPETVPTVPLQRDIEATQKRLRLKPKAADETIQLDLRNENDLARSQMLHRLNVLGINWGTLAKAGSSTGTFKEAWQLSWEPGFTVAIIEASRWGHTLEQAATNCLVDQAARTDRLDEIAELVDTVLLADLHAAVGPVSKLLEDRASLTGDILQLLGSIPKLANVFRYGNVRKTDTSLVGRVLDGVIVRSSVGLSMACADLEQEAATQLRGVMLAAHAAIALRKDEELSSGWSRALRIVAYMESAHALLRGAAARLVLDEGTLTSEEASGLLSANLSRGAEPQQAADWLDGFLNRNAMVLLHDDGVWGLVNAWVATLSPDHFVAVLPLLRRTFSSFSSSDRRDLGDRAKRPVKGSRVKAAATVLPWNADRARLALPMLHKIFGLAA